MKKHLQKFRQNRNGLAYIWGVAACSLAMFPIIYWAMSVLLDSISTSVFASYTFLGSAASAWTLVKALISALPVFTIIVIILWSAVNAKSSSYDP
jgi:hypothetical protein